MQLKQYAYKRIISQQKVLVIINARAPLLNKRAFIPNSKTAFVSLRWTTALLFLKNDNRAQAPSALKRSNLLKLQFARERLRRPRALMRRITFGPSRTGPGSGVN